MPLPCRFAFPLLVLALLGTDPALAADCGDKAGPGRTDVSCSCGDTVVTTTKLTAADPAVYTGDGDTVCAEQGLSVGANGVKLDCDDLELRGDGSGNGIESSGFNHVTIKRCSLREFFHGVRAISCNGFVLKDSSMVDNVVNGIRMDDCNKSGIKNNEVKSNSGNGIELVDSNDNTVKDNKVSESNGNGIDLQNSRDNQILENVSTSNLQDNLELGDSVNNKIKNNTLEGASFAGIHILSSFSNGNEFKKNTLGGNGTFDVHNGSAAGDNDFKRNSCTSSLGPDVDCPSP